MNPTAWKTKYRGKVKVRSLRSLGRAFGAPLSSTLEYSHRMRIHQFNGKESGLMVIGSATELRKLGEQLQALTTDKPEFSDADWPTLVVSTPINPSTDFSLSFHIDTQSRNRPASNVPESETRKTIFFVLAIVGFISLVKWGLSYVL